MKTLIINLAVFKAAWAATVFSAAAGIPVFGAIAVAIAVAIHLRSSERPEAEARLMIVAAVMGTVWESLLVQAGVLAYTSGVWVPGMAPYWIVAMWTLFATTINVGMRWLHRNVAVAAVAGGIGGPMAFAAGAGAGAVNFASPVYSLISIGIGWALLLPILVAVARRLNGNYKQAGQPA